MTTQPIRTLVSVVSTPHIFYLFIYLFVVVVDLVSVISLVLCEQEGGAFLTPGPHSTSSDKGFFFSPEAGRALNSSDREEVDLSKRSPALIASLVMDRIATFC